jgi:thiamine-monophosphate kinase
LVTVDGLVEGVDFDRGYCAPGDVGWKSVAVNLSDIAAMGGVPRYCVVMLALPPDTEVSWVEDFLTGVLEACARWDVDLVGGDLSSAPQISVTVTAIGTAPGLVIARSGASPGDVICITGELGASAGGLTALQHGLGDDPRFQGLVARHLRPEARVEAGLALASSGVTSMIDISDGLGLDLARLLRAGGVGCSIDPDKVPVAAGLTDLHEAVPDAPEPSRLALSGGEDFELLWTVPPGDLARARESCEQTGLAATAIGEVTSGRRTLGALDLDEPEEDLGWDHLLAR